MDLPREFRDLLDRDHITTLIARYVTTLDNGEFDMEWGRSLFTDDVHIEFPLGPVDGVERVVEQHRAVMSSWDRTLHFSSDHVVELDGDRAEVWGRLVALHVHANAEPRAPLIAAQKLQATTVRTADGWRFERVVLRPSWTTGEPPTDIEQVIR
ncbi:nuclear transport factor 2 family protein [Prauserella alba]|uniref:Nuclear transport factor 2 family protein n=1 Tax=Prauserella alba TaxID=176898 RepID=A0ABN1VIM6_9PSEU|nr:nuclear transport factor 2 family protein [Prauserella alba]MCP2181859.1 SnoaL-like domain-containing protein [Prauserella alba]